jgi:hypothetical protein
MNLIGLLIVVAVITLLAICLKKAGCLPGRSRRVRLANIAEGRHVTGNITKKLDAVPAERWVLCKFGSDVDHVNIAGAADIPLGVITTSAKRSNRK